MQILHDFDKFYDIYLQDEYYTKTISERLESKENGYVNNYNIK